jgi:preprotein translocase subunit SecY
MAEEEEKKEKIPIEKIAKYLPAVEKPTYKQAFNKRMMWTGVALISYIIMSHISVYGIAKSSQLEALMVFQTLLGAKFGSLMTLGIGPIVTAGILLQLLVGSKIINWDMNKPENRSKFQTWNKLLAIFLCFVEGLAYIVAGAIPVTGGGLMILFVVAQLAAGGIIVILLDELVSKWGFGSGISLFIAAGVATQIAIGLFSPFVAPNGRYVGNMVGFVTSILSSSNLLALGYLLPMITTVIVFLIVIYAQNIRIDIPLVFSAMRGFGRTWSLKLFYTSNIPVILAAALIANFQLMGRIGLDPATSCGFLACYDKNGSIISGVMYYLTSPRNLLGEAVAGILTHSEIIRAFTYLSFMAVVCMVFSIFWVSTSGMSSASVAEQIENIGMHIPGYRSDKKTIESVLQRYIPSLAVLGGLAVGVLAAFADFTGAIGTGTGILLTVMIIYNYYEELSAQPLEDAHPLIKKVLGE